MITFELESWQSYFSEAPKALWPEHYAELCTRPLAKPMSPDVPFFQFLDARGMLQVLTARRAGIMVGYCLMVVKRHSHYDLLAAFEDSYFLTKSERGNGNGLKLITSTLHHLRKRGVKEAYFMTKARAELDMSGLFEKLGFELSDKVFCKWLGAETPVGAV